MTTATAMAKPHSHGPNEEGDHASRADRPVSFDLEAIPVPCGREEDWRFTPIRRIDHLFDPASYAEGDAPITIEAPEGVAVKKAGRDDECLGTVLAPGDCTAVVAWNTFTESTIITIPKESALAELIRLNVDAIEETQPQHIRIEVGELAEATITPSHRGSPEAVLNRTIELNAADASKLTLVSIQEWDGTSLHASNHRLTLGKDTKLTYIVATSGGDFVRICSDMDFRGIGGELTMLGLYFVDGRQHLEYRAFVDHSQPNCYSRVTYKGVLQDEDAHSVWIGDCLTRETADGTDTYELNCNLMLTEGAKADSVPDLEVENGEIAGADRASATGRFDDEQLFCLMSRGIFEMDARRLVVRNFFAEFINQIGVPEVIDHPMESIEAELAKNRN